MGIEDNTLIIENFLLPDERRNNFSAFKKHGLQ
jgi:hypothetical protein